MPQNGRDSWEEVRTSTLAGIGRSGFQPRWMTVRGRDRGRPSPQVGWKQENRSEEWSLKVGLNRCRPRTKREWTRRRFLGRCEEPGSLRRSLLLVRVLGRLRT